MKEGEILEMFCPLSHNHKVGYDVKPSLIVTEKSAEQVQREQEKIDQNQIREV